ncbi:HNH endonuclease [Anaerovorax odorimutans]|uniref:HNH endonuclease n=1 Tax=Anaerovorax odorimutans TaxID=109327 RepID=A0ABT1RLJ8_9FIRM|nr:HNH endonuclease domain-containing protein [Anaerovorax odorimutans]MCQ4636064.1 HNH endonuclease [Anaerovorax odorimutans]
MLLPYSSELEISNLSRLFDKMSESYKIFWFRAILDKVAAGKTRLTYDELINQMIADAWYMVSEYKLNLGPSDTLEAAVHHVHQISGLKSSEKKETILKFLENCRDKELLKKKRTLTEQVPYRLQAPFIEAIKGNDWKGPKQLLAERINYEKRLMYYFVQISGLSSQIEMQDDWARYLQENQQIIRGWIQYNLIEYLQRRNPSVPGIVNKLYPPQERKLEKVKKYWRAITEVKPLREIYGFEPLSKTNLSIDHFVPWSYVAHDELWNLHPTTKGINSSKNNNLPDWKTYFSRFCGLEFYSYQLIWKYDKIHVEFEKCQKEHLNSTEALRLYARGHNEAEFTRQLEDLVQPVYQSAQKMGFGRWTL